MPENDSTIEIDCKHAILQISNYIDGEITAKLRARIEAHVRGCQHCSAILDGTNNTLRLLADGRAFELPDGFGERLRARLVAHLARD